MNRWTLTVAVATALVATTACSGDDDAAETTDVSPPTTPASSASTSPPTTEPPDTSAPSTSAPSTTAEATTTTVSEEQLKQQIAEDYLRSWELRRELLANPTLEGLDERMAVVAVPGSSTDASVRQLVSEFVSTGDRAVPGSPDLFRIDVEAIELAPNASQATVTLCFVGNGIRVNRAGEVVLDNGVVASRSLQAVEKTSNGWLPSGGFEDLWQGLGVTQCPGG